MRYRQAGTGAAAPGGAPVPASPAPFRALPAAAPSPPVHRRSTGTRPGHEPASTASIAWRAASGPSAGELVQRDGMVVAGGVAEFATDRRHLGVAACRLRILAGRTVHGDQRPEDAGAAPHSAAPPRAGYPRRGRQPPPHRRSSPVNTSPDPVRRQSAGPGTGRAPPRSAARHPGDAAADRRTHTNFLLSPICAVVPAALRPASDPPRPAPRPGSAADDLRRGNSRRRSCRSPRYPTDARRTSRSHRRL